MKIEELENCPKWLKEARTENADVEIIDGAVHWFSGTWNNGTWEGGTWENGTWLGGTWKSGGWWNGTWNGGTWKEGVWKGGVWYAGTWNRGIWTSGTWCDGIWESGTWCDGTWERVTWCHGIWQVHGKPVFGSRVTRQYVSNTLHCLLVRAKLRSDAKSKPVMNGMLGLLVMRNTQHDVKLLRSN